VITSVTRDDVDDGGAHHFALTVSMVKALGGTKVEVLTPDFGGDRRAVEIVLNSSPDVFAHNVETVPRLYEVIRPGADYRVSISILRAVHKMSSTLTKSGLILGLGEKPDEVLSVMEDLRECGCEIITLGQYLPPTIHHIPPAEYLSPKQFEDYRKKAVDLGFKVAFSGPFVRSSFQASKAYELCCSPLTPH
jgi:lipoic acid synthetase